MLKGNNKKFKRDLIIIGVSFAVTIYLWGEGYIDYFLGLLPQSHILSAFLVGIFFTSAFTTAPAIAMLVKLAQIHPTPAVALFGAFGAVLGDSVIFYLIRDRLREDFFHVLKKSRVKRIQHFLKSKIIRVSMLIASGVLLALPLPTDETAFTLLGITKIKTATFVALAFTFNFAAIYLLGYAAKNFVA